MKNIIYLIYFPPLNIKYSLSSRGDLNKIKNRTLLILPNEKPNQM